MAWWQWLLDVAGALLVLFLVYALALVLRRRALSRNGGTFELSCRVRTDRVGRGWVLGLGRYAGEDLEWFRVFSLRPRPHRVWPRKGLAFTGRREAQGSIEQMSLYADHVIVRCTIDARPLELAMSPSSLTGFQSWLESGPPGASWEDGPLAR